MLSNVITWPRSISDASRIPHTSCGFSNQSVCLVNGVSGLRAQERGQTRERFGCPRPTDGS